MFGFLPSRLLLGLLVVPLTLSLISVLRPELLRFALLADGVIGGFALLDLLLSRRARLTVEREAPDVMSLKRKNRVRLRLRSQSSRRLDVTVMDGLFEGATADDLPCRGSLPARGSLELAYHVEPSTRGAFSLGDHFVRFGSLLGFWTRSLRLQASHPLRVYPDLKQIQQFDARARENREYALVRATRLRGGESEFARLRDHVPDDEYRRVDWKATARRQKLTVREYQLESNQNIVFMLDSGRVMTGVEAGLSRFDHALNATLMLAHVAARGGDRVGVVGFDDELRVFVAPQGGPAASRTLIQATYDLHPRLVEPDYDLAFYHLSRRVKNRALVILFTHVIDASVAEVLVRRTRALSGRHLPLVVLFRDQSVESLLDPTSDSDWYEKGAAAELLHFQKSVVREMKRGGALVLESNARELTGKLVERYLEVKARQLL